MRRPSTTRQIHRGPGGIAQDEHGDAFNGVRYYAVRTVPHGTMCHFATYAKALEAARGISLAVREILVEDDES